MFCAPVLPVLKADGWCRQSYLAQTVNINARAFPDIFDRGRGGLISSRGGPNRKSEHLKRRTGKPLKKTVTDRRAQTFNRPSRPFCFFCNFLLLVIFILDFHRGLQNTQLASFSDKTEKQHFCGPEYYLPHLCQDLQLKVKYQFSPVNLFNLVNLILTLLLYYISNGVFFGSQRFI